MELTLLLIVKGRYEFSKRWVDYYNKFNLDFPVLIADGSKNNSQKALFVNKNFKYHYFGHDKNLVAYRNKIIKSLQKIKTKYVLFAANDDFYIKKGLAKALSFLKRDKTYSAARGRIHKFQLYSKNEIYGKLVTRGNLYNKNSINNLKPNDRILEYFLKSNGIWHDIVKTKVVLNAWRNSKKYSFTDIMFHDLYTFLFLAYSGKCKRANYLFMLNQIHSDRLGTNKIYSNIELIKSKLKNSKEKVKLFNSIFDLTRLKSIKKDKIFKKKFLESYYDKLNTRYIKHQKKFSISVKTFIYKNFQNISIAFLRATYILRFSNTQKINELGIQKISKLVDK